jgi:plastocyanin
MKILRIAWLVAGTSLTSCFGGTIAGTVRGVPPAGPAEQPGSGGAYASRRYKFVEKIDYDHLRDFVVYLDVEMPARPADAPISVAVITRQKDANFDPHVLPVARGTKVSWPNEDDIFHNVFSMSEAKQFDLGYYKREKAPPEIVFDRTGQIDVFCAIHSKMHCIILVVPNPFFAKTDKKGRFAIPNIPAGTYKVKAWHERLPAKVMEVVVPASGEVKVDFALSLGDLPKY